MYYYLFIRYQMGNWTDIHINISSVFLYNKLRNIVARFYFMSPATPSLSTCF